MKFGQYDDLMKGYASSSKFKTVGKFIKQPITTSLVSRNLLSIYFNNIRPQVVGAIKSKHKLEPQPTDSLFLTFEGLPHNGLGRLITNFFRGKGAGHITTTSLRSLVETQANCLKDDGIIPAKAVIGLENISGHSSKTAEMYYIKKRIANHVENASSIFDHFSTSSLPNLKQTIANENNQQSLYSLNEHEAHADENPHDDSTTGKPNSYLELLGRDNPPRPVWGVSHPQYGDPNCKRASWSTTELDYLEKVVTIIGSDAHNLMARCLHHIKADPNAIPIFHTRHVESSDRLKNGYEALLKRLGKSGV